MTRKQAQAAVKARWAGTTAAERKAHSIQLLEQRFRDRNVFVLRCGSCGKERWHALPLKWRCYGIDTQAKLACIGLCPDCSVRLTDAVESSVPPGTNR